MKSSSAVVALTVLLSAACAGEREATQPRTPADETPIGDPEHEPAQTGTGTGTESPADTPSSEPPADGTSSELKPGLELPATPEFYAARESVSAAR